MVYSKYRQKQKPFDLRVFLVLAEGEGFEPSDPCRSPVFKTGALDHYATPPNMLYRRRCFALLLPTILKYLSISVNRSILTARPPRITESIP